MIVQSIHPARISHLCKITPSFKQRNAVISDTFVKSAEENFYIGVKNLYKKIYAQLEVKNLQDVKKLVRALASQTGVDDNTIYSVLGRLTAYSSYKSISKIQERLSSINVSNVSNIIQPLSTPPKNFPICLSGCLNYILKRNGKLSPANNTDAKSAIVIDSNLLKYMEYLSADELSDFKEKYIKDNKIVYFEDFENGYNFLNNGSDLKLKALSLLSQIKDSTTETPQEVMGRILNSNIVNKAQDLGLKVEIIKNIQNKEINDTDILKNISPIMPDEESFISTILSMRLNGLTENELEKSERYLLNYIDKMLLPISPKKYSEYLKTVKHKLDLFIKNNNKNPNNIFYLIPAPEKSFITTNYQYRNVNNIKDVTYLFPEYDRWYDKNYDFSKLPPNSTIVILDDCIITGLSLAKEAFRYQKVKKQIEKMNSDISIVLAASAGTKSGIENLKDLVKLHSRTKQDTVITGAIIPQWDSPSKDADAKYLGINAKSEYHTAVALPYMGPDTNSIIIRPLIQKFLYSNHAQKATEPNLDFMV